MVRDGQLSEGYDAALAAARQEPTRFEAYALAALALHTHGLTEHASVAVSVAIALAPAGKLPKVTELARAIGVKALMSGQPILPPQSSTPAAATPAMTATTPAVTAPALAGTTWSGAMEAMDKSEGTWWRRATLSVFLDQGGTGTAMHNTKSRPLEWSQTGDVITVRLPRVTGTICAFTITARINGNALDGTWDDPGDDCWEGDATRWFATRAQ
jgi:hypothetical protein